MHSLVLVQLPTCFALFVFTHKVATKVQSFDDDVRLVSSMDTPCSVSHHIQLVQLSDVGGTDRGINAELLEYYASFVGVQRVLVYLSGEYEYLIIADRFTNESESSEIRVDSGTFSYLLSIDTFKLYA